MLAQILSKKRNAKKYYISKALQVTTCMLLAHLAAAAFEREETLEDAAKWESLKM